MTKHKLSALVSILLLCTCFTALATGIDYDAMTLEEVKALAEEANTYYREVTKVDEQVKEDAEGLLLGALAQYFAGEKVTKPLLGFGITRARDLYTFEGKIKVKGASGTTAYLMMATVRCGDEITIETLQLDGAEVDIGGVYVEATQSKATPDATATPAPQDTSPTFRDYGEQLSLVAIDGICLLQYKIEGLLTNKQTIYQNYMTVENFIKDGGGTQYDEIQYWAVADMRGGDEGTVMRFKVPKSLIEAIAKDIVLTNEIGDYVDDLWILPSLLE